MNNPHPSPGAGISRRHLIAGLGAAGGAAGLLAAFPGNSVVAGPAIPSLGSRPAGFPEGPLQPPSPDLTYVGIDAAAFSTPGNDRLLLDTGVGAANAPDVLHAPLTLAAGTRIRQLNVVYFGGGHRLQVWRRTMSSPSSLVPPGPEAIFDELLPDQGGGPQGQTFATDLTLEPDSMYTLQAPVGAGEYILGVTIGYEPPAPTSLPDGSLSFLPLEPPTRPLDTRQPGYTLGKLASEEVRVLDLGLPPNARAAVINLTITHTESNFGYVSVFAAGIPWPGNSSINWSSPELTAANCVITAVDDQGRIAIRGGEASTHVIVDVLGAFVLPAGIEVA